jgi:hypothetical protein
MIPIPPGTLGIVWGFVRRFGPVIVLAAIALHYVGLRTELAGYRAEEVAAAAERKIARSIVKRAAENRRVIEQVRTEIARCDALVESSLVLAEEWERRFYSDRRRLSAEVRNLEALVEAAEIDASTPATMAVSGARVSRAIAAAVEAHNNGGSP